QRCAGRHAGVLWTSANARAAERWHGVAAFPETSERSETVAPCWRCGLARGVRSMSKHWERDLDNLQRRLMILATSVEEVIFKGIRALQERNSALAEEVIAGDSVIDQEENHVENECLKMLALHQPVAVDLRRIIAALKINTDLERMADLAVNIAERALSLVDLPRIAVPDKLQGMTDLATSMVRQSLDAFVMLNAEQARRVIRLDEEVDRYNR